MPRVRRTLLFAGATALILGVALAAAALNPLRTCGSNSRCLIVDVFDRTPFTEIYSSFRVSEAWGRLVANGPCNDIADVVVGGTFGENGAPGKSTPAGFAKHLGNRCVLVVHYELEALFVIDAQAYDDSVEHGRKALAIVMNALESIRAKQLRFRPTRLRVWGHSKGAAIVESTWRMEARNRQKKFIRTLRGVNQYVDACPSNNCFYFGFGYPRTLERNSRFSISRATGTLWSTTDDGFIKKPNSGNREWWRLTTFTNLSDPIYECNLSCLFALTFQGRCHGYEDFLNSETYRFFDDWNRFGSRSRSPSPEWIGNHCNRVGDSGTFELTPEVSTVVPRERLRLSLEWTVPEGGWRVLDEIQVRLRDGDDILLWVRFDEAANLLGVYDARRERFRGAAEPGSRTTLRGRGARLHVAGSRVLADGSDDPSVILDLEVSFGRRARGRDIVVEVLATDDLGGAQDFMPAGTVSVRAVHGRHAARGEH